jgi:ferric-dicitrate binding protein FerR (iron transport regulator)
MKAIERDPRDRYACAADMLADLKDPGSPRTRERPVRPRRRASATSRRVVSSLAIAVALGALAWLSAPAPDRPAATRLVK